MSAASGPSVAEREAERCPIREWHEPGEECLGHGAVPGTALPCGCYISRIDYNAVLCPEHEAEVAEPGNDRSAGPGVTT